MEYEGKPDLPLMSLTSWNEQAHLTQAGSKPSSRSRQGHTDIPREKTARHVYTPFKCSVAFAFVPILIALKDARESEGGGRWMQYSGGILTLHWGKGGDTRRLQAARLICVCIFAIVNAYPGVKKRTEFHDGVVTLLE